MKRTLLSATIALSFLLTASTCPGPQAPQTQTNPSPNPASPALIHKPTRPTPTVQNAPGVTVNAPPNTAPLVPPNLPAPTPPTTAPVVPVVPTIVLGPPQNQTNPNSPTRVGANCPTITDKNLSDAIFLFDGAGANGDQIDGGNGQLWDVLSFRFQLNGGLAQDHTTQDASFVAYTGAVAPAMGVPTLHATALEPRVDSNPSKHATKLTAENTGVHPMAKDALFFSVVKPDLSLNLEACRYMTQVKHNADTIVLDVILTHEVAP